MRNSKLLLICLTALAALAGCSVISADADSIAIRHLAENSLFIQREADEHCAKFGRKAIEVQRSPVEDKYLITTVVTTFRCVEDTR